MRGFYNGSFRPLAYCTYFISNINRSRSIFVSIHSRKGCGNRKNDTNCWMDRLAERERDVTINARLKCGGRKFRNAVAYDVPRRERQARCIDMMIESGRAEIADYNARLETALDITAQEITEHVSIEHDGTRRAIETCTDCYGEQAK